MSLHQRRQRLKLRFPEIVAALVVLISVLPAVLWAYEGQQSPWQPGVGYVTGVRFIRNSTNTDHLPDRAEVSYQYAVRGSSYTGRWDGAWPQAHSPDALPRTALQRELRAGHLLTVYYDPGQPARNTLHARGPGRIHVYEALTVLGVVTALAFLLRGYPRLRAHR